MKGIIRNFLVLLFLCCVGCGSSRSSSTQPMASDSGEGNSSFGPSANAGGLYGVPGGSDSGGTGTGSGTSSGTGTGTGTGAGGSGPSPIAPGDLGPLQGILDSAGQSGGMDPQAIQHAKALLSILGVYGQQAQQSLLTQSLPQLTQALTSFNDLQQQAATIAIIFHNAGNDAAAEAFEALSLQRPVFVLYEPKRDIVRVATLQTFNAVKGNWIPLRQAFSLFTQNYKDKCNVPIYACSVQVGKPKKQKDPQWMQVVSRSPTCAGKGAVLEGQLGIACTDRASYAPNYLVQYHRFGQHPANIALASGEPSLPNIGQWVGGAVLGAVHQ